MGFRERGLRGLKGFRGLVKRAVQTSAPARDSKKGLGLAGSGFRGLGLRGL